MTKLRNWIREFLADEVASRSRAHQEGVKYEGLTSGSPLAPGDVAHVNAQCSTIPLIIIWLKRSRGPSWWCAFHARKPPPRATSSLDFNKISLSSLIGRDGSCEWSLSAFSVRLCRRTRCSDRNHQKVVLKGNPGHFFFFFANFICFDDRSVLEQSRVRTQTETQLRILVIICKLTL